MCVCDVMYTHMCVCDVMYTHMCVCDVMYTHMQNLDKLELFRRCFSVQSCDASLSHFFFL